MTDPRKAGALILSNIQLFNDAALLYEDIEREIFSKLDTHVQMWVDAMGWNGIIDLHGESKLWLSPSNWFSNDLDEDIFYYSIDYLNDDDDSYNIATFSGVGGTQVGISFNVEMSLFGKNKKLFRDLWKREYALVADQLTTIGFSHLGFSQKNKGFLFLPLVLDSMKLATAYENDDYSEVFIPLTEALGKLEKAVPIFDEILAKAKKELLI